MEDAAAIVVWFRRDLRVDDHPALVDAAASGTPVVPLVVLDVALQRSDAIGGRRWSAYLSRVAGLARDLHALGATLLVRSGDPREVVCAVTAEHRATRVLATRDTTPYGVRRDRAVGDALRPIATLELRPGSLVVEPEATGPVRVFTAFHRRWTMHSAREPIDAPRHLAAPRPLAATHDVAALVPPLGRAVPYLGALTPNGGPQAESRLRAFVDTHLDAYPANRHRLDIDGTSGLSADLHFGTLSPVRVVDSVRRAAAEGAVPAAAADAFLRQLAWRDWAHHLLWFDNAPWSAAGAGEVPWREDPGGVAAWVEGRTGYPVVDAAMRQLAATGTMHNRARMIVASFLTKDLLVDWRIGARHFLRELVDADVANNTLGWRWIAGMGPDAAPFVRVFNPVLQGRRFDPEGRFVRRWIPELAQLPDSTIHQPWVAGTHARPGYPPPIVDHADARRRALAAFAGRRR